MKTDRLFVLAVIMLVFFSCNNGPNQKIVKIRTGVVSQNIRQDSVSVEKLYQDFLYKQSHISVITYNVQRIDTFIDGTVWNNKGKATLERNDKDTIFKFSFYGKRDDLPRENIYRENIHFQIFPETKTYRVETNYGLQVLGAPGGQMVMVDLLNEDTTTGDISIQNINDKSFIIKSIKNEDANIITKILTVDKLSLIPIQEYKTVVNPGLNYKQSTLYIIDNVLINDQVKYNELSNMDFLSAYTQQIDNTDRSADVLIGKKVPELLLVTFDKKTINLRNFESKIVLLDFWEYWCGPCIQSLPKIQSLANSYSSKGLLTIGITTDNIDKSQKLITKEGITFMQTQGNSDIKTTFRLKSVPLYVLIDRQGIIRSIFYGYSNDIEKNIIKMISN